MDFDFGYGTAKFCLKPVPTVFITFVNLPGVHAFAASDVIDAAKRSRSFGVAPLWNDQPFMSINADKLKEVAQWIEGQTTGKGRFITVWVPTDTSTQF